MFKTIKNVIKWWPILREDQDWDYVFLLQVIRHKLQNMAVFFASESAVSVTSAEEAKAMRICIGHLSRLIADDFFDHEALDEKWGVVEIHDKPFNLQRPNVKTEQDQLNFGTDLHKACADAEQARQTVLDGFCQIFKDRVFNWWD